MSRRIRKLIVLSAIAAVVGMLNVGYAQSSGCGFAGTIAAGTGGGGAGYVVLFGIPAPWIWSATAHIPLATPAGDACMDIWRDSVLGPFPANFNAVWAAGPLGCSQIDCSPVPVFCSPTTFCMAFP